MRRAGTASAIDAWCAPAEGRPSAVTMEQRQGTAGLGRVGLWSVLVVALVVGSAFLVVGLGSDGDARLGGFMVAVPCGIVAALCARGLRSTAPS